MIKLIIILSAVLLMGCSGHMDSQKSAYDNSMSVYAQTAAAMAAAPPMLDLELTDDGRVKNIRVAHAITWPNVPTFRPTVHPGWALGGRAIGAAGMIGGIWAGGYAMSQVFDAIGPTTYVGGNMSGSHNNLQPNSRMLNTTGNHDVGDIEFADGRNNLDNDNRQNYSNDFPTPEAPKPEEPKPPEPTPPPPAE